MNLTLFELSTMKKCGSVVVIYFSLSHLLSVVVIKRGGGVQGGIGTPEPPLSLFIYATGGGS